MQTVYGLMSDNGDGSGSINWFINKDLVDALLSYDDNDMLECFYQNEGYPAETLHFPDSLNLEQCGFGFSDDNYEQDADGKWCWK